MVVPAPETGLPPMDISHAVCVRLRGINAAEDCTTFGLPMILPLDGINSCLAQLVWIPLGRLASASSLEPRVLVAAVALLVQLVIDSRHVRSEEGRLLSRKSAAVDRGAGESVLTLMNASKPRPG